MSIYLCQPTLPGYKRISHFTLIVCERLPSAEEGREDISERRVAAATTFTVMKGHFRISHGKLMCPVAAGETFRTLVEQIKGKGAEQQDAG